MPRNSLQAKAIQLIMEDKIKPSFSNYFRIVTIVEGDTGTYRTEVTRGLKFNCECNYFTHSDGTIECAHILAVKLLEIHDVWFNMKLDQETKKITFEKDVEKIIPLIDMVTDAPDAVQSRRTE